MPRRLSASVVWLAALPAAALGEGPSSAPPASPAPLSAKQLDEISAGQSSPLALTTQTLSAVSSGNRIDAGTVQSGQVTFANGAFSGFTGIGNFVVNTGNNNVLQGSLSVTVVPLP